MAFNVFSEVAHVFTFAAVFSRLFGLVNHETGSVSKLENIGYLVILCVRAACPLFALVSLSQVNTFSLYKLAMFAFEGTICLIATLRSYSFLKAIRKQQNLSLPTLALFSNPIATGLVCGAAFLSTILLIVGYSSYIERQIVNQINR